MNECITLHNTKPWVKNFEEVLVRPLQAAIDRGSVNPDWLGEEVTVEGNTWYRPTEEFWTVHCNAAHYPQGEGCSAATHTAFLTPTGADAEFEYCNMMKDGTAIIQTAKEFEEECGWWRKNFDLIETMSHSHSHEKEYYTHNKSYTMLCKNHNIVIAILIAYVVFDLSSVAVMNRGLNKEQRRNLMAEFKIRDFIVPLLVGILAGWVVWWWLDRS